MNCTLTDQTHGGNIGKVTDGALITGWHFVVMTYDASEAASGITLYVDNVVVDQTEASLGSYTAMENTDVKMTVAYRYNSAGTKVEYFQDKLDNIMLFNVKLSATQVSNL